MFAFRLGFLLLAVSLLSCGVDSAAAVNDGDEVDEAASLLSFQGTDDQFSGGFAPRNAPYGGFGGAARCTPRKTPVIFVTGNGDDARNFDFPSSTGGPSVYKVLRAAGYRDCELFGVNWLSQDERRSPLKNYHTRDKAQVVADFIADVLAYTHAPKVDLIGHSMGVTVSLHAIEYADLWPSIRRFISISAAMRGLESCWSIGYANPAMPVCGSQNYFFDNIFGLFPDSLWVHNPRMGGGTAGFRNAPAKSRSTRFYAIGADVHDGFVSASSAFTPGCGNTALFTPGSNVKAQLDVGHGSTADELDFELTDYSVYKAGGGDIDGVGHFRAKNNTGRIQLNMLSTDCTGAGCCTGYDSVCGTMTP